MHVENILVPTDFSEHAQNAYAEAIDLAKLHGARIELLHVYDVPNLSVAYEMVFPDKLAEGIREAAARKLAEWERRARSEGVEVSSHVVFGMPKTAILDHVESAKSDLIVMSTRGLGAIKHALLGSVAERVLREATCPVLSIGARTIESSPDAD